MHIISVVLADCTAPFMVEFRTDAGGEDASDNTIQSFGGVIAAF